MDIRTELTSKPIPPETLPPSAGRENAGAWIEFVGTVRATENGLRITGLEYEAYPGMAERVMREVLESLAIEYPCLAVFVQHRTGIVRVGEIALRVRVASEHRQEGFGLLTCFLDRLKQDVPIWKIRPLLEETAQP